MPGRRRRRTRPALARGHGDDHGRRRSRQRRRPPRPARARARGSGCRATRRGRGGAPPPRSATSGARLRRHVDRQQPRRREDRPDRLHRRHCRLGDLGGSRRPCSATAFFVTTTASSASPRLVRLPPDSSTPTPSRFTCRSSSTASAGLPYGVVPWTTAALLRPLARDRVVTAWLVAGAAGSCSARGRRSPSCAGRGGGSRCCSTRRFRDRPAPRPAAVPVASSAAAVWHRPVAARSPEAGHGARGPRHAHRPRPSSGRSRWRWCSWAWCTSESGGRWRATSRSRASSPRPPRWWCSARRFFSDSTRGERRSGFVDTVGPRSLVVAIRWRCCGCGADGPGPGPARSRRWWSRPCSPAHGHPSAAVGVGAASTRRPSRLVDDFLAGPTFPPPD